MFSGARMTSTTIRMLPSSTRRTPMSLMISFDIACRPCVSIKAAPFAEGLGTMHVTLMDLVSQTSSILKDGSAKVSVDWVILVLDNGTDFSGVARLSRTVRGLRFLRLIRLGRLMKWHGGWLNMAFQPQDARHDGQRAGPL